jgi:Protein of unknown function (DUF3043)
VSVSFLRRKPADESTADAAAEPEPAPEPTPVDGKKGRPTPKRREAEGRSRGPVAPPPKTQREAIKRSRSAGKSLTKTERRALATERRERMMKGDDAYLLPRDRGKVRQYVRDRTDARRNLAGLLLPLAVLSFLILLVPVAVVQAYGPLVLMIAIFAAVIDTVFFGHQLGKAVRAKFPNGDQSGLSTKGSALGFYAFNRAVLVRRWRVPRPRVKAGDPVD